MKKKISERCFFVTSNDLKLTSCDRCRYSAREDIFQTRGWGDWVSESLVSQSASLTSSFHWSTPLVSGAALMQFSFLVKVAKGHEEATLHRITIFPIRKWGDVNEHERNSFYKKL